VSAWRDWLSPRAAFVCALVILWLARALLGLLIALPLFEVVAQSGIVALSQGERALFEAGGLYVLELLADQWSALNGALRASVLFGIFVRVSLTVLVALTFVTARSPGLRLSRALPRAVELVPRFLAIGLVQLLAGALVLAPCLLVAQSLANASPDWSSEPLQDVLALAVIVLGLFVVGILNTVADVTRATLAERPVTLTAALRHTTRVAPGPRARLLSGYVLLCGLGALLVSSAARLVEACHLEREGVWRAAFVMFIHGGVLLGLVALEAAWIRRLCGALSGTETAPRP